MVLVDKNYRLHRKAMSFVTGEWRVSEVQKVTRRDNMA